MGMTFGDGGFFGAPVKKNDKQSGDKSPRGLEFTNSSPQKLDIIYEMEYTSCPAAETRNSRMALGL